MFSALPIERFLMQIIICMFLSMAKGFAQSPSYPGPAVKFGEITPAQFISSSPNTTSEAVVLYESGDVSFEVNVDQDWVVFKHYVRTLIRRKSAYERATVAITVRRCDGMLNEKMINLEGRTYNLINGNIVTDRLDLKTAHFTEKATDSHWMAMSRLID